MSLLNIVFESDTDTSQEDIQQPEKSEQIQPEPEKKHPQISIRYLTEHDEAICSPKKSLKELYSTLFTVRIVRSKKKHINGTRYFFQCFSKNSSSVTNPSEASTNSMFQHLYISKAKSQTSQFIPITDSKTIHLSEPNPLAFLQVANENSDFTLIKNKFKLDSSVLSKASENNQNTSAPLIKNETKPSMQHLMVVRITPPRISTDGARKMHVAFLGSVEIPSRLISLPLTSISAFEGRYMKYSIKNAILVDEKTQTPIITIRKTDVNDIEIDTHYNIDPLLLFGIGIASFLGKNPTK